MSFPSANLGIAVVGYGTSYETTPPVAQKVSTSQFKYHCGTGCGGYYYIATGY